MIFSSEKFWRGVLLVGFLITLTLALTHWVAFVGPFLLLIGGIGDAIIQWQKGKVTILQVLFSVAMGLMLISGMYWFTIFFQGSEIKSEVFSQKMNLHGEIRYTTSIQKDTLYKIMNVSWVCFFAYIVGNIGLKIAWKMRFRLPRRINSIIAKLGGIHNYEENKYN